MSISLSQGTVDQLQKFLDAGDYVAAYSKLADFAKAHTTPDEEQVYVWLLGAGEIVQKKGPFGELIYSYNRRQATLRGLSLSDAQIKAAAQDISIKVIQEAIDKATIPSFSFIGKTDGGIAADMYASLPTDSAHTDSSAWSAAILMSGFGNDQSGRLLNTGTPGVMDTVSDLRDVLFADYVYVKALEDVQAVALGYLSGDWSAWSAIKASWNLPEEERLWSQVLFGKYAAADYTQGHVASTALRQVASFTPEVILNKLAKLAGVQSGAFDSIAAQVFNKLDLTKKVEWLDSGVSVEKAKSDIAYRYALKAANPFAILGADYATLHNPNGELDIYNKTTGQGQLTEEWITDRSKFLTWMIKANTDDKTAISDSRSEQWVAEDKTLKGASEYLPYSLDINAGLLGMTGDARKMIFGKDQTDGNIELITGAAKDDRLYGGGGNDKITGEAGNDYIEGNTGNDQLFAGAGTDTLVGGLGLDTLTGGLDNDLLLGGKDADTYLINAGDGNDTIIDSDGQGHIEWAGLTLQGSSGVPPGQWRKLGNTGWQDQTNDIYYSLLPQSDGSNTLLIVRNGERLQIKQWTAGQLGITLGAGTEAALPTTPSTIYGDRAPIDFGSAAGVQTETDDLGNLKTDPNRIEANRADTLYDSAANDLIIAGGGDDHLYLIRGGNISLNWGSVSFNQGYYQFQYSLGIEKGTAGAINHFRFADRSLSATELLKSLDPLSHANITGDANSPSMGAGDELASLSNTSTTANTTYLIGNALLTSVNDAGGVNDQSRSFILLRSTPKNPEKFAMARKLYRQETAANDYTAYLERSAA